MLPCKSIPQFFRNLANSVVDILFKAMSFHSLCPGPETSIVLSLSYTVIVTFLPWIWDETEKVLSTVHFGLTNSFSSSCIKWGCWILYEPLILKAEHDTEFLQTCLPLTCLLPVMKSQISRIEAGLSCCSGPLLTAQMIQMPFSRQLI